MGVIERVEGILVKDGWGVKGLLVRGFFTVFPIVLLFVPYLKEEFAVLCCALLLGMAGIFLWFVSGHRRREFGALGSLGPILGGPLLATVALRGGGKEDLLRVMVEENGDYLVQMAFYLSAVLGLVLYTTQRLLSSDKSDRDKRVGLIGYGSTVVLLGIAGIFSSHMFEPPSTVGPVIFWSVRFPGRSLLLICRVLLVVSSVLIVLEPRERNPSGEPDTRGGIDQEGRGAVDAVGVYAMGGGEGGADG